MVFSLAQQKALAIIPKITGGVSCIGSAIIILVVARDKNRRSATYHRLIMSASVIDLVCSFWLALSTWPYPRESGRLWAVGTTQTCTAEGFFLTFTLSSAAYNASLSIYYVLTIIHGWKPEKVFCIEPYLHGIPIILGLGIAVVGLGLNLYNPSLLWCFIASFPQGCTSDCIRGIHANIYVWALFYGLVWVMICIITVAVTLVFLNVRKIEKASNSHKFRAKDDDATRRRNMAGNLKRTKQVAKQCFGYAVGFYVCWVPVTVSYCGYAALMFVASLLLQTS